MIKVGQELQTRDNDMHEARVTLVEGDVVTVQRWAGCLAIVTYPSLEALNVDYYVALPSGAINQEQGDKLRDLLGHHSSTNEFGGPRAELDSQNEILALVEEIVQARVAQLEARIASALEAAAECIEMGADYRYAAECVADCLKEDA